MAAVAELRTALRDANGFVVETAEGSVGWVEEIWLDEDEAPRAVAVRTHDDRRALLLAEDVIAVDREHRWVVTPPDPPLLELEAPHLVAGADGQLAASWTTTGARVSPPARPRRLPRLRRRPAGAATAAEGPRPLWQTVVRLYVSLALLVGVLIALVFVIARFVTGAAY